MGYGGVRTGICATARSLIQRYLPYLAASFTGIQVGAALVASEAVVETTGAAGLGFWRYLIASIVLIPFWMVSRKPRISRNDLGPISIIGIGQFGLLIAMLNIAVMFAASARVSFIFATLPLATLIFERAKFQINVSRVETAAIVLSVAGITLLLGTDLYAASTSRYEALGLLAALVATLTGAICSVFLSPYVRQYGGVQVSLLAMLASLLPLGVVAGFETSTLPLENWTQRTELLVFAIGLSSGAGFWCWLYALSKIPAAHVTAFLGLSPITAILVTIMGTEQRPTLGMVFALGLVLGALALLTLAKSGRS